MAEAHRILSPASYSSTFTRNELILYNSLRGFPLADILCLLNDSHGYRIRYDPIKVSQNGVKIRLMNQS